jgi:hyperosmotically inducible periplasmic protein
MRITKSKFRLIAGNAMLMSIAMTTVGMPMAMAADVASDNKTTAYEESQTPVTDTWITTKVKADLLVTEEVKGLDINVSTTNGVVTLAGLLDSKAQLDKAVAVTKAIKGVKSVETKALKLKPAK